MKVIFLGLLLILSVIAIDVPCDVSEPSSLASVDQCSISKNANTLEWAVRINFKGNVDYRHDNWMNLVADIIHSRAPFFPVSSNCNTIYGQYENN